MNKTLKFEESVSRETLFDIIIGEVLFKDCKINVEYTIKLGNRKNIMRGDKPLGVIGNINFESIDGDILYVNPKDY